jgi:hypothetical protein
MRIYFIVILFFQLSPLAKQFSREARELFSEENERSMSEVWYSGEDDRKEILNLIKTLIKSNTGKSLLRAAKIKAAEHGKTLLDILEVGEGSLTDTTLVRRFSPSRPDQVVYEAHSKVIINKELSFKNAVLDLAHELTHYTRRHTFNPYESKFTAQQFVVSTVEGLGGEVDAYLVECAVLKELFPTNWRKHSNCEFVQDDQGKFSKLKGIEYFYKIGPYLEQFEKALRKYNITRNQFNKLSSDTPLFISSAYGVPYPVAALREYQMIMEKVCKNDKRRLDLIREKLSGQARNPAELGIRNNYKSIIAQYNKRCFLPQEVSLNP